MLTSKIIISSTESEVEERESRDQPNRVILEHRSFLEIFP